MKNKASIFLLFSLLYSFCANAQKSFTEGIIVYAVTLQSADQQTIKGKYTFTVKGGEIRKELKLSNGYEDIVLLDCAKGVAYSLQNKNSKKYAIQLKMSDLLKRQEKFAGFVVNNEQVNSRNIAGMQACKGNILYKDGWTGEIYYTRDWSPLQAVTFERFPSPKFLPLAFSYVDENGLSLLFEAESVSVGPVENAVFRIPPDYKMISYKEYKELTQ